MASYALASANIHPYDGTWFTVSATACPSRQQPHFSWLLNRVPSPWIISPRFGVKAENLGNHPPRCFKSSIPLESQGQPLLVEGIPEKLSSQKVLPSQKVFIGIQVVNLLLIKFRDVIINLSRSLRTKNPSSDHLFNFWFPHARCPSLLEISTGRWGLGTKKLIEHFFLVRGGRFNIQHPENEYIAFWSPKMMEVWLEDDFPNFKKAWVRCLATQKVHPNRPSFGRSHDELFGSLLRGLFGKPTRQPFILKKPSFHAEGKQWWDSFL